MCRSRLCRFLKCQGPPIYVYAVGLTLALAFAWGLGFASTIAEPALNALGITTENLTNGVFKKKTLINAVSLGVAFGIAVGLAKLIFDLPLAWLLVPGYLLTAVLTFFLHRGVRQHRLGQCRRDHRPHHGSSGVSSGIGSW